MSITRAHFVRTNGVPRLHSVVGEVCERRCGGGPSWHRSGRFLSTAAAASSDAERYQRSGKRISKKERRTMVVSFVNKYRALNAGKFPTASVTRQEVGGSYYTIREILQEVKFNFAHNPVGEISVNPLVEKGGVESENIPEIAEGESCGQSLVDPEMERHSGEAERVSCIEEIVSTTGMQFLADKVETEYVKTVDAEVGRERTTAEEAHGHPTSRDLGGMTGDTLTNQKLSCDENTRGSFDEHANHCISHEKYSSNRKMSETASSSEKTLLEEASRSMSKENKDELTSFRQPECDSGVPHAEKPPVMVDEKNVKSTSKQIDYSRTSVMSASKPIDQQKDVKSASKPIDDLQISGFDESRKSSIPAADRGDPQQKPSLWSNLKSLADSVFGMWKKN